MNLALLSKSILFYVSLVVGANTIERSYSGGWASTIWTYYFFKDGTFKWNTKGHFGNISRTGTYKIYNDTLEILSGYENTSKTLNRYYLVEGDSCVMDMELKYEYCTPK